MRFFCLFVLVACSSPGLQFQGSDAQRVEVGGWTMDVYRSEKRAQVIRLNRVRLPSAEDMFNRAEIAIETTTGCKVVKGSIRGDAAVVNARLRCS